MQDKVGIIREEETLTEAVDEIAELSERVKEISVMGNRRFNPGWHTYLDLRHLLTVGEACAQAARARKESRGAHSRVDFPEKDPEWGKYIIGMKKAADGSMEVVRTELSPVPHELAKIIEEQG